MFLLAAYSGILNFMPEFLSNFSQIESYGIILWQVSFAIPGVLFSAFLSERIGRKHNGFFGCIIAGLLLVPFNFSTHPWVVIDI